MPKNLKPPSGDPGGPSGPAGGGAVPCCTCECKKQVETRDTVYNTSSYRPKGNGVNKCRLDIQRTSANSSVTITKAYFIKYVNGANPRQHQNAVKKYIDDAMVSWESGAKNFKVRIQQLGCPPQNLNIKFRAELTTSDNADLKITADNTLNTDPNTNKSSAPPSYVKGGVEMYLYLNDPNMSWTVKHEMGHAFGLQDEYNQFPLTPIQNPLPTVTFFAPPAGVNVVVTLKPQLNPPLYGRLVVGNTTTAEEDKSQLIYHATDQVALMSQDGGTYYRKAYYYWVAIEVTRCIGHGTITQII